MLPMIDTNDTVLPVVGLEIHVELATATKMFCRCRNHFGDPPNTNVCPVCIGMPGVLPVMNGKAVELAIKVGLALNCRIADFTKWDRKSYYYPDLPKSYQISQYDLPLSGEGYLDAPLEDGSAKRIRVLRAHLEEDAGKNIHDNPSHTGVDLNRAGVPLLEIVSQPDMNSVEEVMSYARGMHRLVRWLGVSEANMQMGHMRFEPNINLHITRGGRTYKTPIIEVKNLNSFKSLERAVEYEIRRQYEAWQSDPEGFSLAKLGKQNRGFDDDRGQTVFQREKEEAHEYRYFPEPDLVPVTIAPELARKLSAEIGELPLSRRKRYMESYSLSFKDADALTQDAATGDLLDQCVKLGASPKRVTNLLLGQVSAAANARQCALAEVGIAAGALAELAIMMDKGQVNATAGDKVLQAMIAEIGTPAATGAMDVAKRLGLLAVTDGAAIEAWVDSAIAANPGVAQQITSGDKKAKQAFGFLMGAVMKASGGKAPPAAVKELLEKRLCGK
jgi:aspartyl-tRNA(Asn)/glutamyl-tRNA(Gln) amidotransferase subunit B